MNGVSYSPRGGTVFSRTLVRTKDGHEVSGLHPTFIVYIRSALKPCARAWAQLRDELGLQSRYLQARDYGEHYERWRAYEVICPDDSFAAFLERADDAERKGTPFLVDWHFPLSVAPPRGGTGQMPAKPKPKPMRRFVPSMPENQHLLAQEKREHDAHTKPGIGEFTREMIRQEINEISAREDFLLARWEDGTIPNDMEHDLDTLRRRLKRQQDELNAQLDT